MSRNKKVFIQLILMIILTGFTQVTTVMRTSIAAANYGASVEMDAYNFANTIASFLFGFLGTGITTVLIPAYINKTDKSDINTFISAIFSVAIVFVAFSYILRYQIIGFLTNSGQIFINITCELLLLVLMTQFFTALLSVTNAYFQCRNQFNIPKVILLLCNILLIIVLVLKKDLSIYEYASTIGATAMLNLVFASVVAYKNKLRFIPTFNIHSSNFKRMIVVFVPTLFSTGLYQISLLTDSLISSNLGVGKISVLNYSIQIMTLINSLLIANILIYIYPKIAEKIKDKDNQTFFWDYSIFFNSLICLIVAGMIIVGREGLSLLFERGLFNSSLTEIVYYCSVLFILGQPANVLRDLIYRYFYAYGDTKTTFKNSILISIINIIISIILSRFIGLYGVILGTVISSYVSLTMIFFKFRLKFSLQFNARNLTIEYAKNIISMISVTLILLWVKQWLDFHSLILNILAYGSATLTLYVGFIYLLKSKVFRMQY
ncbi:lipid II flippase MurJ [Desulfosporosinus sp. BG]|uniref:murein biosynthesis integral membrane protein MurJ n=1 Tax=Desulfosporosinus sp. BG TaxID=1633135 RepID=UPI000856C558|nr:lipid II flippase MurJ [Desulfosporosinus sp. BG]ODA40288.1 putative peptidoglycan lipid II flippase MurJ [Desulfosporosinus sp. BG]